MKLLLALVTVTAMMVAMTTTAGATVLRLPHKPFNHMTRTEKITYLKHQKWHDNSIIRWWHNHRELAGAERTKDVKWATQSLRIVQRNLRALRRPVVQYGGGGSVPEIICRVFGSQCAYAKMVAWRESRYTVGICNSLGYCGLFQMGYHERAMFATIGYATAYEETVAAHNYYEYEVRHGQDGWGPWGG